MGKPLLFVTLALVLAVVVGVNSVVLAATVASGGERISTGDRHACTLDSNNDAYCWGIGAQGQLGNNDSANQTAAVKVLANAGQTWKFISAGTAHTCAIDNTNAAYCWGAGANGRLGNNAATDQKIPAKVVTAAGQTWKFISAGSFHTCAIDNSNDAYCWGMGGVGQLGNSTTTDRAAPVKVVSKAGQTWKSISAGAQYACAIDNSDDAYCWGTGGNGRLGNNTAPNVQATPVQVTPSPGQTWKAISAGLQHTCAIDNSNDAYCWGLGAAGRLGNNNFNAPDQKTPAKVVSVSSQSWKAISAGFQHSCGIDNNDNAFCWGNDNNAQLGNGALSGSAVPSAVNLPRKWTEISASRSSGGGDFSCGLTSEGFFFCWGNGGAGQLGNGAITGAQANPVSNTALNPASAATVPVNLNLAIVSGRIATGDHHACAIDSKNTAYCWGEGTKGELGNGATPEKQTTPVKVASPAGQTWKVISADLSYTCALDNKNDAYCWGSGAFALGNGSDSDQKTPTKVKSAAGQVWKAISTSARHACAIDNRDQLYCWGDGSEGQLGNGTTTGTAPTPVQVTSLPGQTWKAISTGYVHNCAIDNKNNAYCWGNEFRQPGNTAPRQLTPVQVKSAASQTWTAISATHSHTCAIDNKNDAYCWGENDYGELGIGNMLFQATPVKVKSAPSQSWKAISTGLKHTCAIDNQYDAYCWGNDNGGQLGNGKDSDSNVPSRVDTTKKWVEIQVSQSSDEADFSCGLTADGLFFCWGRDGYGQLGDGVTANNEPSPVPVATFP
jgi:alpha-tubulin suppressor-like RCC1 family protein